MLTDCLKFINTRKLDSRIRKIRTIYFNPDLLWATERTAYYEGGASCLNAWEKVKKIQAMGSSYHHVQLGSW